jgi:hypothetical protein
MTSKCVISHPIPPSPLAFGSVHQLTQSMEIAGRLLEEKYYVYFKKIQDLT